MFAQSWSPQEYVVYKAWRQKLSFIIVVFAEDFFLFFILFLGLKIKFDTFCMKRRSYMVNYNCFNITFAKPYHYHRHHTLKQRFLFFLQTFFKVDNWYLLLSSSCFTFFCVYVMVRESKFDGWVEREMLLHKICRCSKMILNFFLSFFFVFFFSCS